MGTWSNRNDGGSTTVLQSTTLKPQCAFTRGLMRDDASKPTGDDRYCAEAHIVGCAACQKALGGSPVSGAYSN